MLTYLEEMMVHDEHTIRVQCAYCSLIRLECSYSILKGKDLLWFAPLLFWFAMPTNNWSVTSEW